jgi:D-glycero-alpha-D-manno-heptose 1-phosphate guanylyltransferase
MKLEKRECIVLAGGFGTRLKSIVNDRPKCLALINPPGLPFLNLLLGYLIKNNFNKIIFSLGFMNEKIIDYLNNCTISIEIEYVIENVPLGTGGGIKKAINIASSENVLIINADTFFDVNIDNLYFEHSKCNAICSIALKKMINFDRYGTVTLKKNKIQNFEEKRRMRKGLINGGVILLNKSKFLSFDLSDKFSFESDFLSVNTKEKLIFGFESKGYFIDIGVPDDYNKAHDELEKFFIKYRF